MVDKTDNICCFMLAIVDCADTEEHKHFICADNKNILSNETVKSLCIDNFKTCLIAKDLLGIE